MSYLPKQHHDNTELFPAHERDFLTAQALIADRWKYYPLLPYSMLASTVAAAPDTEIADGVTGETYVDALYGDPIPESLAVDWENPHSAADPSRTKGAIFRDPLRCHMRVYRDTKNLDITKFGFDEYRDLTVVIPLGVLDAVGITVAVGDTIAYDNKTYRVIQRTKSGYWKNTTVRQYMTLSLDQERVGA